MTTPANLDFTAILTRVMNSLRMSTTNTTESDKVAAVINEVYRDICAKKDWWWLEKRTVINTDPKITDGTVSVTQNATALVFSTATQRFSATVDVTNNVILIPGQSNDPDAVYRIAQNTDATNKILDAPYTDTTNTAAAYRLYRVSYDLPADVGKLLLVKCYGDRLAMRRVGREELSQVQQIDQSEGKPRMYSIYDFNVTGDPTQVRQLQIHPYPDKAYRMEVWYKQNLNTELAGADQTMIPDDFRQTLVYGSLARCYPIFLNDLERGSYYQSVFNDVMALMATQQREYSSDKPGFAPDMRTYRPHRTRPRTAYVLGSWFDRLPFDP